MLSICHYELFLSGGFLMFGWSGLGKKRLLGRNELAAFAKQGRDEKPRGAELRLHNLTLSHMTAASYWPLEQPRESDGQDCLAPPRLRERVVTAEALPAMDNNVALAWYQELILPKVTTNEAAPCWLGTRA